MTCRNVAAIITRAYAAAAIANGNYVRTFSLCLHDNVVTIGGQVFQKCSVFTV